MKRSTSPSQQSTSASAKPYATQATVLSPDSPKPGDDNYVSQVFNFTQVDNNKSERKSPTPPSDSSPSYADVVKSPPRKKSSSFTSRIKCASKQTFPSLLISSFIGPKKITTTATSENASKPKHSSMSISTSSSYKSVLVSKKGTNTTSTSKPKYSTTASSTSSFRSAKSTSNASIAKKFKSPVLRHTQSCHQTITNHNKNTIPTNKAVNNVTPHTSSTKKKNDHIDLTSNSSTSTSNNASATSSIIDVWTASASSIDINHVPYKQPNHSETSIIDSSTGLAWGPESKG